MAKEIFCAFSIHCDAVAGWLGSYKEDSPGDISRGVFAAEVGMPRILDLLRAFRPEAVLVHPRPHDRILPRRVRHGGEGGARDRPRTATATESAGHELRAGSVVFDRSIALIEELTGKRPTGYVAPWWEVSTNSVDILLKNGIKYDHSLMHRDFEPYYVRVGDRVDQDRLRSPPRPDEAVHPRQPTKLVEIPASWYLDDLPPMMFIKGFPTATAMSARAIWARPGRRRSTGSTGSTTTPSSR
ncbi:MAG: hypothetical protein R3D25_12700 [Geminicoccaceae bacterium]